MILPNSDISIMDVRNALGYPSTDLGTLCSCDNVNMWSNFKPFPYKGIPTENIRNSVQGSGLKSSEMKKHGIFAYFNIERDKPKGGVDEPYRLGDFRGYNHNAYEPKLDKGNHKWIGAPDDTDGIVSNTDTEATVYLTVQFPDIYPSNVPTPNNFADDRNKIQVITYYGTNRYVVYSQTYNTTSSYESLRNTRKEIEFKQNFNIPNAGGYYMQKYYLVICGNEVSEIDAKIYKLFVQNPNDESQWVICDVDFPSEFKDYYVGTENFKYLKDTGQPNELYGLKINNLWCLVGGNYNMYIDAYNNGQWVEILEIKKLLFDSGLLVDTIVYKNGTTQMLNGLSTSRYQNNNGIECWGLNGALRLDRKVFTGLSPKKFRVRISTRI